MRLEYFRIENFRNITLAECECLPDLMVICGANGCGKSAILHAIMAAKEHAAPYGGFQLDPRCVSSNAERAEVELRISFSELERTWYQAKFGQTCPEQDEIVLQIQKGGQASVPKRSQFVKNLLSWYSREFEDSPGFFDYIDAHRTVERRQLSTWNSAVVNDQSSKERLAAVGAQKFNLLKEYLVSLVMGDAQDILAAQRKGEECKPDSLKEIRVFFDEFFAPMRFVDVRIDCSPFKFIIQTPKGEIDFDDLSSGEKEILSTFIHFHQLGPDGAVILFDEVDAHLHPDLERRYLRFFQDMARNNQLILTTHSPEIMVAAGSDSLYSLAKLADNERDNQLSRVTESDALHEVLASIMGTNGMVTFNKKVIFIEGTESSADRYVFEALFPPSRYNLSFVPAGDSGTNLKIAERVNELLSSPDTFQEFYTIVDGDISRPDSPDSDGRLFRLPVYHIENFLLDTEILFETTSEFLLGANPYASEQALTDVLMELLLSDTHLKPFTRALFDGEVAAIAKQAYDHVYRRERDELSSLTIPTYAGVEQEARAKIETAIADNTWQQVCKGRDLIKAFCSRHGINYEHFRNSIISKMQSPPPELDEIFRSILGSSYTET